MNNKKAQLSLHIEGIGMCTGRVCVNDSLVVSVPDWMEVRVSCPLIGQYSAIYHEITASDWMEVLDSCPLIGQYSAIYWDIKNYFIHVKSPHVCQSARP